jgi:hypothetical protein
MEPVLYSLVNRLIPPYNVDEFCFSPCNIARGESKGKKLQGGKTKFAHITGGNNLFTLKSIIKNVSPLNITNRPS